MPRILLTLTALLTAIVVAAGCGSDGSSSSSAAGVVPAGSLIYGEATLEPEGDQKAAIDALIEKFPGEGSAGERIRDLMEKAFAESDTGLSYAKDIEPWLGDQAAFFLSRLSADGEDGDGALLRGHRGRGQGDGDAREGHRRGQEGQLRGHRVHHRRRRGGRRGRRLGRARPPSAASRPRSTSPRAAARSRTTTTFKETLDDAPDERLGFIYVNTPPFLKQLRALAAGAAARPVRRLLQGAGAGDGQRRRARRALRGHRVQVARLRLPDGGRGRRPGRRAAGRLVARAGPARPRQDARQLRRPVRRAAGRARQPRAAAQGRDRARPRRRT